jgi:hypothetical protein
MFARRHEATPVPTRGSKIRPSELRSLVYVERRVGISRPPPLFIDLTQDDEDDYQIPSRNDPLEVTSNFAALAIRPRGSPSTPRQLHSESSSNPHRSAAQRTPRNAQTTSSLSVSANRRSNKRKESESGEEGEEKKIWSAKRRLRARKQVAYAENDVGDDMDLDDPPSNPILSIEQDENGGYDSDAKEFDVERVIAQRTGPNGMHEYLLGWVGYTELNWIPAQNCNCAELIAQFHAVPQFDFPAKSEAGQQLIEQARIRWLERYVGRKEDTPARPVRAQRPRTARNPRTGRFERKRVGNPLSQMGNLLPQIGYLPPHIEQVVTDSEDNGDENTGYDEDMDALMNAVNNLLRDAEDNEIHIPFPRLSPFDALGHDSNQRLSESPSHEQLDCRQEDQAYDTISIRQTPAIEDIFLPVAHAGQRNQRPRQTARICWARDTPGAEQEQTSFMHMRTTDADGPTTMHPQTSQISQEHPAQASRWIAIKSKPDRLPHTTPRHEPRCAVTTHKINSSASAYPASQPHAKSTTSWSAINARSPTSSELIPGLKSSSPSRGHGSRLTIVKGNAAYLSPASSPSEANAELIKAQGAVSKQPRHAESSQGTQASAPVGMAAHKSATVKPKELDDWTRQIQDLNNIGVTATSAAHVQQPFKHGMPRAKSFSAGPASYRRTKSRSPLSVPQASQPVTAATTRTAQLSWDNQLRAAFSPTSNAGPAFDTSQPPVPERNQSSQSPCITRPLRDADSESAESDTALGVRLPFGLAMSQAMQALDTGNHVPSLLHTPQLLMFNMGPCGKGDLESQCASNVVVGEKTNLQQEKPASLFKSSQGSVIKSQVSHGFGSDNGRTSKAIHRGRRKKSVAKSPLLQSRVSTIPTSSNTKPGRRKVITALQRGTDAIEAEIASTTGPHLASKKTVAAVLSTASTNALRRPAFVHKQGSSAKTREAVRSPSVATKEFMEAREQERREKEAPTLIRAEVNRDYGPYYPKGLSLIAQSLAAESLMSSTTANLSRVFPKTRHGFNFSDDIPRPSIEG